VLVLGADVVDQAACDEVVLDPNALACAWADLLSTLSSTASPLLQHLCQDDRQATELARELVSKRK